MSQRPRAVCSCAGLPAVPPLLIALHVSFPGRRFCSGARTQSSGLGPSWSSCSAVCCRAQVLLSLRTSVFFVVRLGDEWRVMSGSVHLQISDVAPGPLRALNKETSRWSPNLPPAVSPASPRAFRACWFCQREDTSRGWGGKKKEKILFSPGFEPGTFRV